MTAAADMPDLPRCLWDDVLDALYARAHQEWDDDRPEVADALAMLADGLAREPAVAGLRGEL